jgi:DNA ligase 1
MSTPSKKRKKNSDATHVPNARSIDTFFTAKAPKADLESTSRSVELADEDLARKLQAQFDEESQAENARSSTVRASIAQRSTATENEPREVGNLLDRIDTAATQPAKPAFATDRLTTLSLKSATSTEDPSVKSVPLDESPLTFEPSKYGNELQQSWASLGGRASYGLLTHCFVLVNSTTSRIKFEPDSLLPAVCKRPHSPQSD